MKISLIGFGVLIMFLMFSLPPGPVLKSFGYPGNVKDINDPEKLLYLLQQYHEAIVRINDILNKFFFNFGNLVSCFFILVPGRAEKKENLLLKSSWKY